MTGHCFTAPGGKGPFLWPGVHNGDPAQKEIAARHDPPRFPQDLDLPRQKKVGDRGRAVEASGDEGNPTGKKKSMVGIRTIKIEGGLPMLWGG